MNNLRFQSILAGLSNDPQRQCECEHYKQAPTLFELELSTHKHRNPKMQKIMVGFFNAIADKVSKYESDTLKLFKLPDIERIRQAVLDNEQPEGGTPWKFEPRMMDGYKRIVKEFRDDMVGKDFKVKQPDDFDIYETYEEQAFVVSREEVKSLIERALLKLGYTPEQIAAILARAAGQFENIYYQTLIREGGKRIVTELGLTFIERVAAALEDMARTGNNPLVVGRWLHNNTPIGEGKLWYWNRIARSEATLASNAAFNFQAKESGVLYEKWSAGSLACDLCASLDGQVWKIGEGPESVTNTHPHCMCVRVPLYLYDGVVQPKWDRPSPYKNERGE